jgi:hypothetical protein
MSTPTSNTSVTSTTSSGLGIGLIIGGIVLAMIIIGVVIYVLKKRRNGANLGAAPSMPSPVGPNGGMPGPTGTNVNSTRLSSGNGSNGRPQ